MVQEVESLRAELEAVPLGDLEVLVYAQVAVEVSGPPDVRPNDIPILALDGGRGEAIRVEY